MFGRGDLKTSSGFSSWFREVGGGADDVGVPTSFGDAADVALIEVGVGDVFREVEDDVDPSVS